MAELLCDDCYDPAVEQEKFSGLLCEDHLNEAYAQDEADLQVKAIKEDAA